MSRFTEKKKKKPQIENTTNNTAQASNEKMAEPTDTSLAHRQARHQLFYRVKTQEFTFRKSIN